MKKLTEKEYETLILEKASFLIQFGATWCSPCSAMFRVLESIENEYKIDFVYLDVDECPNVSESFAIRSVPTLVLILNGYFLDMLVGVQRKDQIDACLKKHLIKE